MARDPSSTRFEALVQEHHSAVYRTALRILRSDAEAQDVTQEVFLRVLDGRLRITSSDGAEVERVLRWWSIRVALNERRGETRRAAREERHAMERDEATRAETPSEDLAEPRLWGLVDELPDDLRLPLMLRFAEGIPFARIGEALGVAESTAHERVGRALGRLRQRLAHVGLGAFVPALEERLEASAAEAAASASVTLPPGLLVKLIQLKSAGATSTMVGMSSGLVVSLVGGLALVTVAAVWRFVDWPARDAGDAASALALSAPRPQAEQDPAPAAADRRAERAPAEVVATRATPEVAGPGDLGVGDTGNAAPVLTGTVEGRVVDAEGAPLAGTLVTVHSVERAGKFAAYVAKVKTDEAGEFRAAVVVADAEGGHYLVQVTRLGYTISTTEPTRVRAGATVDVGAITATALAGEVTGTFALDLAVVDVHGAPVVGAGVEVASVVDLPVAPGTLWPDWYARGDHLERIDGRTVTDAGGVARFAEASAGAKLVRVVPRGHELAPLVERFDAAPGDAPRLVLVAEPGRTISGTLSSVDGGVSAHLAQRVSMHVREALTDEWRHGELADDGSFVVRGLPPGVHRVQIGPAFGIGAAQGDGDESAFSATWFDVEITRDAAGSSGHDIVLKLATDPRDVGHHAAELHGRLVRSEDGAPCVVDSWALEVEEAPDFDTLTFRRDWLPNHLFPRPVQRMISGPEPADSADFHLTGLQAGRYIVRCTTRGRALFVHGPLELGEREVRAGLVFTVEPAGSAAGRVLDPDGRALDGALVLVTGTGPLSDAVIERGDRDVRSADGRGYLHVNGTEERSKEGVFLLGALPSGLELRLVALHPEYAPAYGPTFTLTSGQARTGLEVQFTGRAETPR